MNSPETSTKKNLEDGVFSNLNCTPKNEKTNSLTDEFCLYGLHRESSPSFGIGQDGLEIGWGDSPEPLNMEQKYTTNKTPVTCKKKLETKESPRSSLPFKRRNVRSSFSIPTKPIIDVAKYVAEVQELSKNIMKEFSAQNNDSNESERTLVCTQLIENNLTSDRLSPAKGSSGESEVSQTLNLNKDSAFDSVLQSFINEEDDWLSQALSTQEVPKTPCKSGFAKSRSENELSVPKSMDVNKNSKEINYRNINNNFRRTSSFDLTKSQNTVLLKKGENGSQKNSLNEPNGSIQYSLQEIEKKRLEAKYRRERREIERKKLEAMKRLEMKKLRVINT